MSSEYSESDDEEFDIKHRPDRNNTDEEYAERLRHAIYLCKCDLCKKVCHYDAWYYNHTRQTETRQFAAFVVKTGLICTFQYEYNKFMYKHGVKSICRV